MTLEQALITALSVVWGVSCVMGKVLWRDMLECRKERSKLNDRVGRLEREAGISEGQLDSYENCPATNCPFRGGISILMLFLGCLVLSGCESHLKDYTRSYYLAGVDQFGQRVEIGATFTPPQARSMMETLQREGVIAPGAGATVVEVKPEALETAGRQLEILKGADTGAGQAGRLTTAVGRDAQPPSSAVPTVWLASPEGKLRVETDVAVIAMYRAAGWKDAMPPGFEDGEAPQWDGKRGRWKVRELPRVVSSAPKAPSTGTRLVPLPAKTAAKAAAPWERGGDAPWGLAREPRLLEKHSALGATAGGGL